jgi:hypothetical protein
LMVARQELPFMALTEVAIEWCRNIPIFWGINLHK